MWNGNIPLHQWKQKRSYSREKNAWLTDGERRDNTLWLFEEESFVPTAMIKEGRAYSILTDHLGTPTGAYDAEGNEVWGRVLNMNGEVIEETEKVGMIPFLFQGQYYDRETGLAYNRFRYYSPQMGIYISQDPIGLAGGLTNLFAYVDDTNVWIDSLGLQKSYSKQIKQLQEGENGTVVTVTSKKEADFILKKAFPDAQKVRGLGSQDAKGIRKKHKMDEFKKKDGRIRYRKDYPIDSSTGLVYGHEDPKGTGHGKYPHINIKRSDGTMVRIDIVNS